MARKLPKTLDTKGADNQVLVRLVESLHDKRTPQAEVVRILTSKGYTTATGVPITVSCVKRFERMIGLGPR